MWGGGGKHILSYFEKINMKNKSVESGNWLIEGLHGLHTTILLLLFR